jgi:hypothetical protein
MLTDIHDSTVLRVELANRVVSRHAAVPAEGCYDLILEFRFRVYYRRLPLMTCAAQNAGFL